ncbi:hypothetical protein J2Z83_001861 [Virgibacillus natechei]|uniref:Uncharacterized protein n=1 Tax=Virgibacillus natechei TaxID=1216297 RepID=A0ABS4IFQ6_9BACI|nr:hypothetical protein [Virgibacillus natechei]
MILSLFFHVDFSHDNSMSQLVDFHHTNFLGLPFFITGNRIYVMIIYRLLLRRFFSMITMWKAYIKISTKII